MDKGYVSKILAKFEKQGLIARKLIPGSKGLKRLQLTRAGIKEAEKIDSSGDRQMMDKLKSMDEETCEKLCEAMMFIEKTLCDNDICKKKAYENELEGETNDEQQH